MRSPGRRRPAARATRPRRCAPMSTPSAVIRPEVGAYMRASSLTSVDFPAPFSPTIATTLARRAARGRRARAPAGRCRGRRRRRRSKARPSREPLGDRQVGVGVLRRRRSPRARPAAGRSRARCRAGSPSSPTAEPTYAESRPPAVSTSTTAPGLASRPVATQTTAATKASGEERPGERPSTRRVASWVARIGRRTSAPRLAPSRRPGRPGCRSPGSPCPERRRGGDREDVAAEPAVGRRPTPRCASRPSAATPPRAAAAPRPGAGGAGSG